MNDIYPSFEMRITNFEIKFEQEECIMENLVKLGAVCGRFQVFHNDHLKYVLSAKEKCEHLIVGITSPDASLAPIEKVDENRGKNEANPCTYFERMMIIEKSLLQAGLQYDEFHIVPFPIGKAELVKCYVPLEATCFFTIYDLWGEEKVARMSKEGYNVEVLWKSENKGLSSSFIRKQIAEDKEWKQYVPEATYDYMKKYKIDLRIKNMINENK